MDASNTYDYGAVQHVADTVDFDLVQQEVYVEPSPLSILSDTISNLSVFDWFIVASCIVGAITIILLGVKFTPAGKFVRSLFNMWTNLLKKDIK